jgi:hypothetical protein
LVYADDVSILGGSVHTVKKTTVALVAVSKETGLEANADKPKYMVRSRDRNTGRSHSITINNSSFERVVEFKYLLTKVTNPNSIQEEIKNREQKFYRGFWWGNLNERDHLEDPG